MIGVTRVVSFFHLPCTLNISKLVYLIYIRFVNLELLANCYIYRYIVGLIVAIYNCNTYCCRIRRLVVVIVDPPFYRG